MALTSERKTEIEKILVGVLEDYELADYPMSISKVANALGIDLVPHSRLAPRVRELAVSASEDGFSLSTPDLTLARIIFDDRGSYHFRARFSGGHELGHIILEHHEGGGDYEDEADYFSGFLLVPHPLVIAMGAQANAASVSDTFGVSIPCASFAIDQARKRQRKSGNWLLHEQWLLDNAKWKGGGLLGCA